MLEHGGGGAKQIDKLAIQTDMSGLGRFLVTKQPHDIGGFRTMGLRNLLVTAAVLPRRLAGDAVGHDRSLQQGRRAESRTSTAGSFRWADRSEDDDLVAFLASLTSPEYADAAKQEYEAQFKRSRTDRPQRDTAAAMGLKDATGRDWRDRLAISDRRRCLENPALLGGD